MGTLNAFYVRAADADMALAICAAYPTAYTEPGTEFFAVDQARDRFRCPEDELQAFSDRVGTDVIWLSFQSVVDAFQYQHWHAGKPLRSLAYGCFVKEREWERVEGTPQPWENAVFFGDVAQVLKLRWSEDKRNEIESIYRAKILKAGAHHPSLDAREAARGVADFYRLPGWS